MTIKGFYFDDNEWLDEFDEFNHAGTNDEGVDWLTEEAEDLDEEFWASLKR